jgi:hypothetical protein
MMIETAWQKEVLAQRRERRDMLKAGWEWVSEGGGALWELHRGFRIGYRIVEAKVGRSGLGVWVKVEDATGKMIEALTPSPASK